MRVLLADDLGLCVLSLIQSRDEGTSSSSQLMQGCLNIFMALRSAVGPCLRIVVECFMKQVFIRSLLQISGAIEAAELSTSKDQVIFIAFFFTTPTNVNVAGSFDKCRCFA